MYVKRCRLFAVLLSLILLFPPVTTVSAKAKPKLNKTKLTIVAGKTRVLQMKNTTKKVTWSVDKKKVVALTKKKRQKVTIRAKKAGTAKVTGKIGKKKYVCKVTVKKASDADTKTADTATATPASAATGSAAPTATPASATTGSAAPTATSTPAPESTSTAAPTQSAAPAGTSSSGQDPDDGGTKDPGEDDPASPTDAPGTGSDEIHIDMENSNGDITEYLGKKIVFDIVSEDSMVPMAYLLFTAPVSGTYTFEVSTTSKNLIWEMARDVYEGESASLETIYEDYSGVSDRREMQVNLVKGEDYHIRIFSGSEEMTSMDPDEELCEAATLTVLSTVPQENQQQEDQNQ